MGSWHPIPLPRRYEVARHLRLVGRRYELEVLERAWSRVEAGERQVVLVGGEPGSGKTRLAAEAAGALRQHDVTVLIGAATKDAGVPYQPFVQILDHLSAHLAPDTMGALLADAPFDLARLSTRTHRDWTDGDPGQGDVRRDLFEALSTLFRRLADEAPIAVILDDVHWATMPSIAAMSHVASTCVDTRMLLMATLRTTAPDRSNELSERLADLHRLEGVHRLDLSGLDTDAIAEFLADRGAVARSAARAPAAILRDRTGGNPFFLRELWADLQRRGGVLELRGRHPIPASIGDTIGARLAGLGPSARDTIDQAAVLGETFDMVALVRSSKAERGQTIDAIDAAAALGLIEAVDEPPDHYGFVHALTREVVLDRLPAARLRLLHARAAEALDRGPATHPDLVPRLAHHYLSAHILGYHDQALQYAMLAARQAARSLAYEEAAQWFERAAALPESDTAVAAECLFGAADNLARAGDYTRAQEIYRRVAELPDPLVRLRAAMGYEESNWQTGGVDSRAADLLSAALAGCGLEPDDPRYVSGVGALGRALAFAGEMTRAREVGARAVDLARRCDDAATIAHVLRTSMWHGTSPQHAELQLHRVDELSVMARESADHETLASAAHFGIHASYTLGRPADLERYTRQLRTAVLIVGQPFANYVDACVAQARAYMRGEFAEAERLASAALETGASFYRSTEGPYGVQMFMARRETGGLDQAGSFITGHESLSGRWLAGMLALFTELGRSEGMRRALKALLNRDLVSREADGQWPIELGFMADAAADLGDADAAAILTPFLERFGGMNIGAGMLVAVFGSADRFLARFADLRGDHARADELFASALAMDERMGSPVHVAETLARHAVATHARGDGERARDLAQRARAVAGSIGQVRVTRWLDALVPAAAPGGLTDRELEVLRLLADGLSNREIGARLYISAHTVANHVRSILTKTGAANRTQAARYATDRHLA